MATMQSHSPQFSPTSKFSEGLGFEFPSCRDIICFKNSWRFNKNIRSCVDDECCCQRTVNISNVLTASGMNPKVVGSSPPSDRDIFCLKISDTFTTTSVNVSKMNAVSRAQLAFQMWLEHSAWIRRLWVRVPLRSRHFQSQKLWHFPKNTRSCIENECFYPRTVNISNVSFTFKK